MCTKYGYNEYDETKLKLTVQNAASVANSFPPVLITSSGSMMMTHNDVAVLYARNFITYNRVYICYCSQTSKTN